MIHHAIKPLLPEGVDHARGATVGQEHLAPLLDRIGRGPHPNEPGEIIHLDFTGVEAVTFSYIKATLLALLVYAGVPIAGEDKLSLSGPPLNIFPMVVGLSDEVREELDIVLASRKVFCLEAVQWTSERVEIAKLRGSNDSVVVETLAALVTAGCATSSQLYERSSNKTGVTAWNNRLSDLFDFRLARRFKRDRQWVYESLTDEVING